MEILTHGQPLNFKCDCGCVYRASPKECRAERREVIGETFRYHYVRYSLACPDCGQDNTVSFV